MCDRPLFIVVRNRVFSENIVTPPKNYEKPGFFGFCRSHGRAGGQKPGFFENLSLQSVI
jgi:hypothetical protein